MNKDINRFQANTLADILLFLVVATGLFALVVHWPAARAYKTSIVQEHRHLNRFFPSDFKLGGRNILYGNVNR